MAKITVKSLLTLTALALLIGLSGPAPSHSAAQTTTYVEPALRAAARDTLAVIVTAGSSTVAAQAVANVGGEVTSDLWLINAVAARVPASRLEALAAAPEVVSIVDNKGVQASGELVTDRAWPVMPF